MELLDAAGETVSVAESCTGGWLGMELTTVPGASSRFWGGAIAYADHAKQQLLGIDENLIRRCGAVSEEVAARMAAGIRRVAGTDWGLGVTGVAGPTGGSPEKPVGTVWIAVDGPTSGTELHRFTGNRARVRREAVTAVLGLFRRHLQRANA
jgi:nicotinamide-nucleotide amidase